MVGNNLGLIKNAMDAAQLRQEMISSNIANVNTEGYKVNKVEFESLLQDATNGVAMKTTNQRHFGGENLSDVVPRVEKRTGTTVKDNGNNVDIEVEMLDQYTNSIYYDALVNQLNTQYAMLKSVITK
ncbi:flagellar basal body rod protein FlgB [Pisciglobus halotolerans]|uniref:Flagellar basal body rod protein FlgB n=1 Tax=Pisciglobus halotolerans TaxID=745365 RepID=A0A1I3AND7_9LACT|nr:flagellar basal body rod protein FlgB [Pisciglobus halotolerans]SFH51535.1 flagellar basal-body rod protein FlgB [Pisciglobus halotolerans]